ncbi:PH domain-containing protein [Aeromonas veronii]|uniref:PH domain-containing protein n=1 Tax=Aeromonas veronii TaxID=654 RepID=UPI00214F29CA|nr:PH domain-containing protein [Aeromonas veronii]MCR3959593.1 PH domain-containing protein [Aeromonas veronii]
MGFDFKNASAADRKAECKRIAAEVGDDLFFTKKELDHLPEILLDGERVISFTSGMMDGNTWLITLTDKRIIFLDKGMLYGLKQAVIDLDKVNAVSGETGLILGSISIQDGAATRTIKNVQKKTVVNFTNKVRDALEARKRPQFPHPASTNPAETTDVISQLERLASLKEKGMLSQDEFEQQKSKLIQYESHSTKPSPELVPSDTPVESAVRVNPTLRPKASGEVIHSREVSTRLIVGIVLCPWVFSWFTLKKGYSTTARAVSLGWLFIIVLMSLSGGSGSKPASTTHEPAVAAVKGADGSPNEMQDKIPSEPAPDKDAANPVKKEIINVTFNLTPAQFQKKFNTKAKQLEDNLAIANIKVGDGDVNNSFKYMFNKNTGLVGTVDKKTGKIMSFMFLFGGSQDQQEILNAVSIPLFISQIVNPEQDKGKTSKIIVDMITKSLTEMDGGETITHNIGSVQYSSVASQYTGLMLAIEPINPR